MPVIMLLMLIAGLVIAVFMVTFFGFLSIWIRALMAGVPVPIYDLIRMKLRRVPPALIVDCYIRAHNGDLDISIMQLEKHYLAGGRPDRVVDALVRAYNRDIPVPFDVVAKTDLAGFNVDEVDPEEFKKAISQTKEKAQCEC